ncbi:carbon-nitrogen hydrolase family protein [Pseudohalocynthiibacter aestuariivivens]|uniref:Carbon-nitrogen hydrolase family protein n=1 Tax=Pseudohalocynthiibacter aestuariivivens TaxID=1591409 RepID=A0ABV5JLV3_9RHOB|nr:carbon-nitrogen hydrolase family protein [Pseudohalocynthiibacter aestuariivivens]MBS9717538.1 carbon-nitrogen hydrolase family protein [Pseudohalocynthiibacter aestuariivivens]
MTKVAIIQEPPVYLNLSATMDRAVELVEKAARDGAKLTVFPEAWFPGYPTFVWRLPPGAGMGKTDDLFAKLQTNSIDLSQNGFAPLQEAARENDMVIVAGYQELDGEVSGSTLFNSCITIDADGRIVNNHRKLMPTNPERMVWGFGDGSGLNVVDTAVGRIGALICWENYMPMARAALYTQNIDIYVAPTWDSGDTWLATMQHIAREGGCWVIGCATALEASDIPTDIPHYDELFPNKDEWVNPGDAVVYKPFGDVSAGPMHREKGLLVTEIDVSAARASRRKFDASGHYARPDVFKLSVNRAAMQPVAFTD